MLSKKHILEAAITHASREQVLDRICHLGQDHQSSYVCVSNVHMLIETYKDTQLKQALMQADMSIPDGKPLSIAMNLLYGTVQERIAGPDLMIELFRCCMQKGLSIFFYGSTNEVLSTIQVRLEQDFPNLSTAGMFSPPFRPLSKEEDERLVEQINRSGAHIVFVALGCPKQEHWMHDHLGKINAVMIGVGAAFPFYSGHLQRCPKWMQDFCLEWLYRLYCEPKRLFWRYFISNSLFLLLIAKQMIFKCLFQRESLVN